uniref:Uncharacterized protein n=1 Tax=Arundo donax TaxID=35708 RepID=A0A0A9AGH6_ARUDO
MCVMANQTYLMPHDESHGFIS